MEAARAIYYDCYLLIHVSTFVLNTSINYHVTPPVLRAMPITGKCVVMRRSYDRLWDNTSTDQEPIMNTSTDQEPIMNTSTDQEPIMNTSTDQEPIMNTSTDQE